MTVCSDGHDGDVTRYTVTRESGLCAVSYTSVESARGPSLSPSEAPRCDIPCGIKYSEHCRHFWNVWIWF